MIQFIESVLKMDPNGFDRRESESSVVLQISIPALKRLKGGLISRIEEKGGFMEISKCVDLLRDLEKVEREINPQWEKLEREGKDRYRKKIKKEKF